MGRIKSAFEIAMEKMDDIEIDEERIRKAKIKKDGQILAGSFLNDLEITPESIKTKIDLYNNENKIEIIEAIKDIILSNISLPSDTLYESRLSRVKELGITISNNKEMVSSFFDQIAQFFSQYIQGKQDFIERLKQQFGEIDTPQKQQQLMQLTEQNLSKMEKQFKTALEDVKNKLKKAL